jgi:outer membrane protein assembly factor BamD (BamD/ComL family)
MGESIAVSTHRILSSLALALALALVVIGCASMPDFKTTREKLTKSWNESPINPYRIPTPPPAPAESLVLKGDGLEPEKLPGDVKGTAELQGAHELYRRGEYEKAERLFHSIADNTKNPPQVAEEARYFEAECLRRQEKYPKASDTYNRLLNDFHFGVHREEAMEREFEIANYWLDDTRAEIRKEKEQKSKPWVVVPAVFVPHFEKAKPLLDEEGRALETLEHIVINDLNGSRADEALFLAGSVKFYREDYKEADRYFSQLVDFHPRSKYAPQAMEYAIISKHMSTGGSDYDGRKVAEARKYVDIALRNYVMPADKNAFLERQLAGINYQQAEKDFRIAEFYRHTGHPGSAYFYYEIVRRRYPGTPFFDKATERMYELKANMDKKGTTAETPGFLSKLFHQGG